MEIREALEFLVKKVEGGTAGLLISLDGETIERYSTDSSLDLEWIGARYGVVARDLLAAVERQDQGAVRSMVVELDKAILVIAPLRDLFFLLLLIRPGGNLGQALFQCRMSALGLEKELAI
jgi:predicted regulator of Ras-like GTPase activity (Roadblock/LC7/MglB family)